MEQLTIDEAMGYVDGILNKYAVNVNLDKPQEPKQEMPEVSSSPWYSWSFDDIENALRGSIVAMTIGGIGLLMIGLSVYVLINKRS